MVITMPVKRTSEFGYFLAYEDAEVLLHRTEATRELEIGEEVEVFLYHDHENRLAATMQMPYVKMGEYGWLKVEEVSPRMGVFLYNGIKKDLLLFVDDLPKLREEWPQKGDRLLVTLTRDEQGRLLAKPAGEKEMVAFAQPAGKEMLNKRVEATVYKVIQAGAFLFTENEHILFIHRDEMTEPLRLGQTVICRVSFVREDGRLNGSMRQRKEIQYSEDADRLLQYLVERDGAMPYTDDTPPDTIKRQFQMSKAAFKRALGKLLRERLIEQEEGWTHLNRDVLDKYRREEGQTELPD
nr:S1-like domain-containing RNA-binding protein [Brevibacillus fulvus]